MKKIMWLCFVLLLNGLNLIAQCNCNEIQKKDGIVIVCAPMPVAKDKFTQIGIALASNSQSKKRSFFDDFATPQKYYISLTVRFKGNSLELKDNLYLHLLDNSVISLKLVNSGLDFIGESEVANAVYSIDDFHINELKKSTIKHIGINFEGNIQRMYKCELNENVLIEQFKCY